MAALFEAGAPAVAIYCHTPPPPLGMLLVLVFVICRLSSLAYEWSKYCNQVCNQM